MSAHRFSVVPAAAVSDERITNAQFRTLSALAMYANKEGWCYPSQSTIGEDLGKSRQTVNEDIAHLVEYGYVEKYAETMPNNQVRMNYRIIYDYFPTGGVETPRQGVSNLSDSNAPLNAPYNVLASVPSADTLSIENQIYLGKKTIVKNEKAEQEAKYMDAANLISMGFGVNQHIAYGIAYTFMHERGIVIPENKIKGQRKAIREMIEMGVMPNHVMQAVKNLLKDKMTVTDLYSISKTAIALANPAPDNKPTKFTADTSAEEYVE